MDSSNNWLLFILILIIIVILVWALLRNRPKQDELPAHHEPEKEEQKKDVLVETSAEPANEGAIQETVPDVDGSKNLLVEIPDDLEIIEGIGPKIARLLQEAGITTFAQLAEVDIPRLKSILLAANLRVNDPTSWPEQAKLASSGKMEELKQLQDRMKGGRV